VNILGYRVARDTAAAKPEVANRQPSSVAC
jgi:hypothetical protein